MTDKEKTTTKGSIAEKKTTARKIVKMVDENGKAADVHPNEVENYKLGGFVEAK